MPVSVRRLRDVVRWLIERKLSDTSARLRRAREELVEMDHQVRHFADEADETRIRSLVSETPLAGREHNESQRHADAMTRAREHVQRQIHDLERQLDELLDRLSAARR